TGSLALIGDVLEDQQGRGRLMGTYRTFGSLAFAIAALTGGWLADAFGLRVPFMAAAGCYLLAFLLSTRITGPTGEEWRVKSAEQNTRHPAPGTRHPAPDTRRALWSFLALLCSWMFAMGAVVSLWPVYMTTIGYSTTMIGGLWGLAALGEVVCMILA